MLGNQVNQRCECGEPFHNADNIIYRGDVASHKICPPKGVERLRKVAEKRAEARTKEQAEQFGFAPTALEDLAGKEGFAGIFSSRRNRLGNPEFRRTGTG